VVLGVLRPVSWRLPELRGEGVVRVRITEEAVLGEGDPELVRSGAVLGDGARAASLRASAFRGLEGSRAEAARGGISDTRGWSSAQVEARLEEVKAGLGWAETEGSARKWWLAFERENASRPALVLRLAEELLERKATVTEFFLAYVYSNTDNIQANLHFLDYTRLKKREERRRRERGEGRASGGEDAPATGAAPEGADSSEGGEASEEGADERGGGAGDAGPGGVSA
jgi:ATP-dependent Clp protease ATP-binding subunit ClpX